MSKKIIASLNSQYHKYLRVWRLMRKPTTEEFKTVSKVTAVGLLVIGAIGFIIATLMNFFF